jgi:amino acid adenylation domain-containing protein
MNTEKKPSKIRSALAANQDTKEKKYWEQQFSDPPHKVEYSSSRRGETHPDCIKAIQTQSMSGEQLEALRRISGGNPHAVHIVLLAVHALQLYKSTGAEDIFLVMPIYKQKQPEHETLKTEQFINTVVPIRIRLQPQTTFKQLLLKVRQTVREGVQHQNYPIRHLIEKIKPSQNTVTMEQEGNPLYEVAVLQEDIHDRNYLEGDGINIVYTIKKNAIQTAIEPESGHHLEIEYNAAKYDQESIKQILAHNLRLLEAVLQNPDITAAEVNMQTEDELRRIEKYSQGPVLEIPKKTIHHMVEEQARKTPLTIALTGPTIREPNRTASLTYRELNERADRLALRLQERGVGPDTLVALKTDRNIEMVIGMLGILKAGGAYLGLDPNYPDRRNHYMLEDSNINEIITEKEILEPFGGTLQNTGEKPVTHNHTEAQLCYIIYTSGTTGKSKGIMMEHRNLVNLLTFQLQHTSIAHGHVLQYAGVSFDVSFQELFATFLMGGTAYIADEEHRRDVPRLFRLVERNRIETLFLPASYAKYVLNSKEYTEKFPPTVKHIVSAGEQIVVSEEFKKLLKRNRITLHNHYGPSEAHVVTTLTMTPDNDIPDLPNIGRPIANVSTEILDRNGNRQPDGVVGELFIGGQSVGRGYLNRPELTADSFVENYSASVFKKINRSHNATHLRWPVPRDVYYRTGDMAMRLPDGNMEFLGRMDHQVKIRGYRIEPAEIENHIMGHPGVNEAVVIDRESEKGEKYLCAYFVAGTENNDLTPGELKKYLSARVPEYMVPAAVVNLKKIPLTPNRKLDRNALPAPETTAGDTYVAPRNRQEENQVRTWARILEIEPQHIGIDDNFFAIGGHSLKATGLINRLSKEYGIEITLTDIFQYPTIRQLTTIIEQKERKGHNAIEPAEEREYYPQSPSQKRLFILQQMDKSLTSYNMPTVVQLNGKLDREKIQQVFKRLIQRHESFRTSFLIIKEQTVQRVHTDVMFRIEYLEPMKDEDKIREAVNRFIRPFDMSEAPLLRVGVIETGEASHVFIFDMHHIICDGTTQAIFNREFMQLYNGEKLPPLKLQYRDYSQWLRTEKKTRDLEKQEKYWFERLNGELPVLNLPTDYPRPDIQRFEGNRIAFFLDKIPVAALGRIGEQEGASRFMVLQAITSIWLWKLSGQEDIVIGTPIAARRHADLDSIIGMMVNALVFRNNPNGNKTFRQYLNEVKKNTVEAFENQEYPFEELVEKVNARRDPGRNPLFDVMFALQNMERTNVNVPHLDMTDFPYENLTAKFDMNLEAYEYGERITFVLEYGTALFKKTTVRRFIDNYLRIIAHLTTREGPDTRMSQIDVIGPEEKQQLLEMANGPREPEGEPLTVHRWFQDQVEKTPESIALVGDIEKENPLTYRQLNERSDVIAHRLAALGIGTDDIVGMRMHSCIDTIIAILGILKAGGGYLPLDPEYPEERIQYMVNDSNAKVIITKTPEGSTEQGMTPGEWNQSVLVKMEEIALEEQVDFEPPASSPSQLCYVIYTSGSTGSPKGVMLEHRNLVNLLRYQFRHTGIDHRRVLQFTTISFDVSFQEIFSTLLSGGTLFLMDREIKKDVIALYREIRKHEIRTLYLPASFLKFIIGGEAIQTDIPESVTHIVTAGEQLTVTPQFREYLRAKKVTLHNQYGPSETHVVTAHTMTPGDEIPELPPIGRPITNTRIAILDKYGNPQPLGVAGELLIGGTNVGRGYLNQPELTAERYIKTQRHESTLFYVSSESSEYSDNSTPPVERHYKTGDLARWRTDGTIQFLGRIDRQVKIRGYRIELGEIENRLQAMEEVKETVVTVRTDESGEAYLCAYIVPSSPITGQQDIHVNEIRRKLAQRLPEYMQPARYVQMKAIPLTPSKKVDRNALPAPSRARPQQGTEYHPPGTPMEKLIAEIWKEKLELDKVGIHDNFFDQGGNSLKLIAVTTTLNEELKRKISVMELFQYPTIHTLANALEPNRNETTETGETDRIQKKERMEKSKNRLKNTRLKIRR